VLSRTLEDPPNPKKRWSRKWAASTLGGGVVCPVVVFRRLLPGIEHVFFLVPCPHQLENASEVSDITDYPVLRSPFGAPVTNPFSSRPNSKKELSPSIRKLSWQLRFAFSPPLYDEFLPHGFSQALFSPPLGPFTSMSDGFSFSPWQYSDKAATL